MWRQWLSDEWYGEHTGRHSLVDESTQSRCQALEFLRGVRLAEVEGTQSGTDEVYNMGTLLGGDENQLSNGVANRLSSGVESWLLSGHPGPITEEELAFGRNAGFPTGRQPAGVSGNRYILIVVDYYSRFLFAESVPKADRETVVKTIQKIAKTFRWPIAIYCDNASYFVKGKVPEELKTRRVMQFSAPITHPSSVGLSERYVQLVLTGLRTVLAHENKPLDQWDAHLDVVVFAINNRILRIHGFTPLQLFMGISPRAWVEDISVRDEAVETLLADQKFNNERFNEDVGDWNMWMTIAEREEHRDLARGRIKRIGSKASRSLLSTGRRFSIATTLSDKGKKLEPKWEGPYRVAKVTKSGVSVLLEDLCIGRKKGRYAVDDIKTYLVREQMLTQEGYTRVAGRERSGGGMHGGDERGGRYGESEEVADRHCGEIWRFKPLV